MNFLKVVYPVHMSLSFQNLKKIKEVQIPKQQLFSLKGGGDDIGIVDLVDG